MQRFEYKKGASNKFWEVELRGTNVVTRFGRIGTTGQQATKRLETAFKAKRAHDQLIVQKTGKGYVPVTASTAATNARIASKRAAAAPEFETAIAADPEGVDAYVVYGDWLQSTGDPRGELIAIQHARLTRPKDAKLAKVEQALISEHAEFFFGPLAKAAAPGKQKHWGRSPFSVEWHLGFFRSARLGPHDIFGVEANTLEMLPQLWELPSARVLRELSIGAVEGDGLVSYDELIPQLVKAAKRAPPTLRSLFLGDFEQEEWEVNWTTVGSTQSLYKAFPRLETLRLHGSRIDPGKLVLPELRELDFESDSQVDQLAPALARAELPNLERLHIRLGPNSDGLGDLGKLMAGRFGKLAHLAFDWVDLSRENYEQLVAGKMLGRLATLCLSSTGMTDGKLAVLAPHAAKFAHLEWLDLDNNLLSASGQKLAKRFCKDVRFGEQQEPDSLYEWEDEEDD